MWLDRQLRQRIVGAIVLGSLVVVFLPMLFSRRDTPPPALVLAVEVPPRPQVPAMPNTDLQPVAPSGPEVAPEPVAASASLAPATSRPAQASAPAPASRLDASNLPVSWSVQLASLSSRTNAEALVQKLRSQSYNAYVRTFDGMNRVFVGPLIERGEADRLREQLQRQQGLNGFVVRFQPERQ